MRQRRASRFSCVVVVWCALVLALWPAALGFAQGTCAAYKSFATGDSLTASDLNSLQTVLGATNMEAACIDGLGDSNAQFDDTLTPVTSAGARVLSTQLYHDVVNLRYVALHVFGSTTWWSSPYENVNFRHRMVRQHFGVLTGGQQMFRGEAHLAASETRFHLVSYSISNYNTANAHPESVFLLLHVAESVRFKIGLQGDTHIMGTLGFHTAGTATHAVIFRHPSPASGIFWPVVNHLAISSINIPGGESQPEGAAEVARFHLGGIFLARSHVNGTTPPRNTLSASNLIKGWARVDIGGQLLGGFNVTTVARGPDGTYVVTWQNPFIDGSQASVCSAVSAGNGCNAVGVASGTTTTVYITNSAGTLINASFSLTVIGAQ